VFVEITRSLYPLERAGQHDLSDNPATARCAVSMITNDQIVCLEALLGAYLIVDRTACYQSGSSFKDGARTAPTTLTQITDAFAAMLETYEDLWKRAEIER
jgi:hypothetical protein